MSYEQYEHDVERGAPIELYLFEFGTLDDNFYAYTNADREITSGGIVYKPVPINREAIKTTGKTDKGGLSITVPVKTDLANLFLDFPPPQTVFVTMRAGHLTDPGHSFMVVWTGRVLSSARVGNEAQLTCESSVVSMKRPARTRYWQHQCSYLVYDSRCRLDKETRRVDTEVQDITSTGLVILPAGWNQTFQKIHFRGGFIQWDSPLGRESRTIMTADDTGLSILGTFRGIEIGTEVTLYMGCERSMAFCRDVHDNVANFGGQPWIPFENPVETHNFW